MCVCVCACVRMSLCMDVCVCVCACVRVCMRACVDGCVCVDGCMHLHVCVYAYVFHRALCCLSSIACSMFAYISIRMSVSPLHKIASPLFSPLILWSFRASCGV